MFIGFLVAMLARRGVTQVLFDKDRGLEILVRALGGEYQPLKSGEPTGFNPLAARADATERRVSQGLAPASRTRRHASLDAGAERPRSGAARNAGAGACRSTTLATHRVHRCDSQRRRLRTPGALVSQHPRRLCLGIRQ
ncbi:MAG: hypothetical protein WDO56_05635 [Gammaproteobacteria bacterium]